ncbi:MAG: cyclic nucleotide-binding domain-containing protein [Actinobacteria bacterium]|nr:cyclic nucleotide-binding domain-containing protein [Actinomycetota bacterium]
MKRREEVVDYLTQVPLFSACSKKDLALIARHSDRITMPAGTAITKEGRVGYEFFILLEGKASVERAGKKIATLGPGDFFGELSLLHRAPRNATVAAVGDVEVLVLGQREFSGLLEAVPSLAHKLLAGLARRIHDTEAGEAN